MNNNIKFIYLDVGGVALLDYSKTNKWDDMITQLSVPENKRQPFKDLFKQHSQRICKGEDTKVFVGRAKSELGIEFKDDYDMTADFVSRFEKNESILQLIPRLKDNFQLGLLTAQYPGMLDMIFAQRLIPKDIWDVIIDSSIEGVTKPDLDIYLIAERRAGIKPESILFVDNKEESLVVPRQRGWMTLEYDPATPIESTKKLEEFIYD